MRRVVIALMLHLVLYVSQYVPVSAQVRQITEVSKDDIVVEFAEEAAVANSASKWLDILGDSITPRNLHAIVLSNVGQTSLVYGSAIAYEPGAYDFVTNNITDGVPNPDGKPSRRPTVNAAGEVIYCPYAYRGANWVQGMPFQAIDLAAAYDYSSADTEWFQKPRELFVTASDDSGSGFWSEPYFDEGAGNISMTTYAVAFSTQTNLSHIGSPYNPHTNTWFLGVTTIDVPLSAITLWQAWTFDTWLVVLVIVVVVITVIGTAVLFITIFKHRKLAVMRASSPVFNMIMLVGMAATSLAALPFVILPTPTNGICQLRVGLASMGAITILAPLFAKTYRIARLFDNPKFRKLNLRDAFLLVPTLALIGIQLLLLLAWLFIGDNVPEYTVRELELPERNPDNPFFRIATCTENTGGMAATGVMYIILVVGGGWFAYRARKAPIDFNESAQILACIAFMCFYGVLLVPMFFIIRDKSFLGSALLRALGLTVGVWLCMAFLFGPKIVALRRVLHALRKGPGTQRQPLSSKSAGSGLAMTAVPTRQMSSNSRPASTKALSQSAPSHDTVNPLNREGSKV